MQSQGEFPQVKKKLLIVAGAVVGLLILLVVLVPLLVNGESFRPLLEAQMTKALARETKIGSLSISLLSGGAKAGDLSIADDPAFSTQPFLTAKSISIGVELIPLIFSKKLNVTGITISEPRVRLIQNRKGVWNYASLGAAREKPAAPPAAGTALNLSIEKIKLEGGDVSVTNEGQSGKPVELQSVNATVGPITPKAAVPLKIDLKVAGGGTFTLQGQAGPANETDATRTPFDLKATIGKLDLEHSGLLGPNPAFVALADFDGGFRSDGKTVHIKGKLKADKARFSANSPRAPKPVEVDVDTAYELVKHTGVIQSMTLRAGAAAVRISGSVNLSGETPVLNAHLGGAGLPVDDLQALLPSFGIVLPSQAKLQGGTLKLDLSVSGTASQPLGKGSVALENTKLVGYDLATQMKTLATLAGLKGAHDTAIQLFGSDLDAGPEGLKATGLKLVVPAIGELAGDGTVSPRNDLDFTMVANINPSAGIIGGLSKITGAATGQGGLPFKIAGTSSNPRFVPDVGRFVKQKFSSTGTATKGNLGNAAKGLGKLFGKQK
jgi:AsmA protein